MRLSLTMLAACAVWLRREHAHETLSGHGGAGNVLVNRNFRRDFVDGAVRRTGIAPFTPHKLRDVVASPAVSSGASVMAVQRTLGHASAAMTLDIHAGLFSDDLEHVAERLNNAALESRA